MKKIFFSILLILPFILRGQFSGVFPTIEPTFGQIKARAKVYYDSLLLAKGTLQGTGYTSYKRWEWFWDQRIGKSAKISDAQQKINNYYNLPSPENFNCPNINTWEEFGPNTFPNTAPTNGSAFQRGIGMVSFVRFHPQFNGSTQQTMYVGGVSGLWRSINEGQSWSLMNTDRINSTSCADLAINSNAPNTLYLATGQEKSMGLFDVFGSPYERFYGVLKTTDGSSNWTNVGPQVPDLPNAKVGRIRIHPTNPNIIYLVLYYHSWVNNSHWEGRIYKSIDAGNSWNNIFTTTATHLLDMEFKPDDPNTFYASGYRLFRFNDNQSNTSTLTPVDITAQLGNTWTSTNGVAAGTGHAIRLEIEVTPNAPNNIYAIGVDLNGFRNLWVSTNTGTSFTARNPTGVAGLSIVRQMMSLAVSLTNSNEIFMGGIDLGRSTDGGSSFTSINVGNQLHADNREIECFTVNGVSRLYTCNDAGLYTSTNAGNTWQQISNGLGVGRYYGISISSTPQTQSVEKVIGGLQDCTTLIRDQTSWFQPSEVYGDGMMTAIDPSNNNIMYRESQFGGIDRTTDGLNFSGVQSGAGNGGWVTPYMLFPNNNNRLLIGRENMNIVDFTNSTVGALTVRNNPLRHDPSSLGENVIQAITMSESNENVVYTSYQFGRAITNSNNPNAIDRCLFRSIDGGVNWTDISPVNFTYPNAPINSILVHPNNPNKIWIARGGYDGPPILTSNDGGTTWVDYSQGLGFMPATCIVINPNRANDEEIYLATDVGVFYRNKYMSQWECYNGLLPNVRVSDLKVNRHRKTLYAATYGRGIWRTSLFCPTVLSYTLPTSPLNFYAASSFISSSSIIDGGRDVAYRAPSIYLTSGFKVVLVVRFANN